VHLLPDHEAAKEAQEGPVVDCPECNNATMVLEDHQQCAACGYTVPEDAHCFVCGQGLSVEDYALYETLCSYHAHVLSKDD
jgi:hypothetical protein